MKFGIGIHSNVLGHFPFEDIMQIARLCDDQGIDVSVPDVKYTRDYVAMLTLIAQNTRRVRVGTMLTDPYVKHPALTAVSLATIDELAGGRAFLGLGLGIREILATMGITRVQPMVAMKEAVEVIRALWTGETVNYEGEVVTLKGGKYLARARRNIPIYIWAVGSKLLQTAGEVADCAVMHQVCAVSEKVRWGMEQVRIGVERAGRHPNDVEIGVYVYSNIGEDSEEAKRAVVESATHPIMVKAGYFSNRHAKELASWDYVKEYTIAGTAEECVQEFTRLADLGVERAMIRPCIEETPEAFSRFITALGREVIPRVT